MRQSYIVQASSVDAARGAVTRAGGIVTGDLEIIRAVGADLDSRELAQLWQQPPPGLRVYDDAPVTASSTTGAWPGYQTFCGWKGSGVDSKGGLGPYTIPRYMREQSLTVMRR